MILIFLSFVSCVFAFIHVRNGRLVDDRGGELIFHGLNLVNKNPPYHTTYNQNDMKFFQSHGINAIRLGVMWPGVQPRQGQFNYTYLNLMRNLVQQSSKYGIYTLVQFHQDLFSQKFCADGVPMWAIPHELYKNFPRPVNLKKYEFDENGYPRWQNCSLHSWGLYYFSQSVAKSFGSLWNNRHGLRDKFIRYWKKVAQTFKQSQHVIAYEIMNQPWPGDQFINPLVMVPGLSQIINMQHAYDIIAEGIRQVDSKHSICFQPVTWLNYFRAGFSHPPGGKKYANESIFCYHYYNPPTFNLKKFMKARMKDVARLKTGGLLSQFYVINQQGQKNIEMMDECDDNLQSWFGWIYDIKSKGVLPKHLQSQDNITGLFFDEQGNPNKLVDGITRVYAPRVAGETISQKFDVKTKKFVLTYYICPQCGQTIIFVSEQFIYTSGFTFECFPNTIQCKRDGQFYIKVTPTGETIHNSKVIVSITAL